MSNIEAQLSYLITISSFRSIFSDVFSNHSTERLKNFFYELVRTRPNQCFGVNLKNFDMQIDYLARTMENKFKKSFKNYTKKNIERYASSAKCLVSCTKGCLYCMSPFCEPEMTTAISMIDIFEPSPSEVRDQVKTIMKDLSTHYGSNQAFEIKILSNSQINITSPALEKILMYILKDQIKLISYLPTHRILKKITGEERIPQYAIPNNLIKNIPKTTKKLLQLSKELNTKLNNELNQYINVFIKDIVLTLASGKNFTEALPLFPSEAKELDISFKKNSFYNLLITNMIEKNLCTSDHLISIKKSHSKFQFFGWGKNKDILEPDEEALQPSF